MFHNSGVPHCVTHHVVSVLPAWCHSCLHSALQRNQIQVRTKSWHHLCQFSCKKCIILCPTHICTFQALPWLAGPLDAVQEADGSGCTGLCFSSRHLHIHHSYSLLCQTQTHLTCGGWGTAGCIKPPANISLYMHVYILRERDENDIKLSLNREIHHLFSPCTSLLDEGQSDHPILLW